MHSTDKAHNFLLVTKESPMLYHIYRASGMPVYPSQRNPTPLPSFTRSTESILFIVLPTFTKNHLPWIWTFLSDISCPICKSAAHRTDRFSLFHFLIVTTAFHDRAWHPSTMPQSTQENVSRQRALVRSSNLVSWNSVSIMFSCFRSELVRLWATVGASHCIWYPVHGWSCGDDIPIIQLQFLGSEYVWSTGWSKQDLNWR